MTIKGIRGSKNIHVLYNDTMQYNTTLQTSVNTFVLEMFYGAQVLWSHIHWDSSHKTIKLQHQTTG